MPAALPECVVSLPGGLALSEGRCLGAAELRPLTGREEEWLSENAGAPSAVATSRALMCCAAGPSLARIARSSVMASYFVRPGDLRGLDGSPPSRCSTTSVVRFSALHLDSPAT